MSHVVSNDGAAPLVAPFPPSRVSAAFSSLFPFDFIQLSRLSQLLKTSFAVTITASTAHANLRHRTLQVQLFFPAQCPDF